MTDLDPNIAEGLARIRRRRLRMWLVLGTYIPGVLIVPRALHASGLGDADATFAVALWWLAALAITTIQSGFSRCPQCGKLFYMRGLWSNNLTRKCLNCGLPIRGDRA